MLTLRNVILTGTVGFSIPVGAYAGVACDGGRSMGTRLLSPVNEVLDGEFFGCHEPVTGRAAKAAIWTWDWDQDENSLTIMGTVDVEANAQDGQDIDADAQSRAVWVSNFLGTTNTLINHATITASAHAGVGSGGGAALSFGIYTNNWNGTDSNSLYNYGNINTSVTGGSGAEQNEAHGIRMGQWNGTYNYFENWGDIELSGTTADGNTGNAKVFSGFISNRGMNGEENILLNFGNFTGSVIGGDDAGGAANAVLRGINLAKHLSTGSNIFVGNWGDMTLSAKGGDNAGGSSHTTVTGIQFSRVGSDIDTFALVNYGTMDLTGISGVNNASGNAKSLVAAIQTGELRASEEGLLGNYGVIRVFAQDEDSSHATSAYGITFSGVGDTAYIYNEGIIEATADSPLGVAVGIGTSGTGSIFDGHVFNAGKIVARGLNGSEGYAIYLGAESAEQVVDPETNEANVPSVGLSTLGFLEGRISTGGQSLMVYDQGGSVYWTVEDTEGAPNWDTSMDSVFYSADGLNAATFDTSLVASKGATIGYAANTSRAYENAILATAMHRPTPGFLPWVNMESGRYGLNSEGGLDGSLRQEGFVLGAASRLGDTNTALSLSFGTLTGTATFEAPWMTSSESDSKTSFLGAAIATEVRGVQASASLRLGNSRFDNKRHINNSLIFGGIETGVSQQKSNWASISGEFARSFELANGETILTPFISGSYTSANLSGYTESGDQASAQIAGYTSTSTTFAVGTRVIHNIGNGVWINGSLRVFETSYGGDKTVAVTMMEQDRRLDVSRATDRGVSLQVGFSAPLSDTTDFAANLKWASTNNSGTSLGAYLGVAIKF